MKKNFLFESNTFTTPNEEYCALIRVEIQIATDKNWTPKGTQNVWNWQFVSIYDEDNKMTRKFVEFSDKDQEKILKLAESLAETYNWEAELFD